MSYPKNSLDTRPDDAAAGIEITAEFEQFTQRNDVFTRAMWDDAVKSKHTEAFFNSYRMEAVPRRGAGFAQKDFALRNASWLISDVITNRQADTGKREGFQAPISYDTPVAPTQIDIDDTAAMSSEIKRIARFFGADLCGITDLDERWLYRSRVDTRYLSEAPNDLPEGLTSVIVMGPRGVSTAMRRLW